MGPPTGAGAGMVMGPPHMAPPNSQVYDFPASMDDEPGISGKGKKKRETKKKVPKEKEPKPPKTPKTPKTPKIKAAGQSSSSASSGQNSFFIFELYFL
jgi:hypothetical protein